MPQLQLPIFPVGVTPITNQLAFQKADGQITYFNGQMPVFTHAQADLKTFRLITSQFVINGNAKQSEIVAAFGVPKGTVKRYVKLYREEGPEGFYKPRGKRGATVLTSEVLVAAQKRLADGESLTEVAEALTVMRNTLSKAVSAGKLHLFDQKKVT